MAASARYTPSKHPSTTNKYDDDDEDDDLDALREAALMTLNSKKRKVRLSVFALRCSSFCLF